MRGAKYAAADWREIYELQTNCAERIKPKCMHALSFASSVWNFSSRVATGEMDFFQLTAWKISDMAIGNHCL